MAPGRRRAILAYIIFVPWNLICCGHDGFASSSRDRTGKLSSSEYICSYELSFHELALADQASHEASRR